MQNTLLLPSHIVRSCRLVAGRRYAPAWSVTSRAFQSSASRSTPPQPSSEANDSANVNLDTPADSVDPVDPNAQLAEHRHDSANTGQSSTGRKTYMSGLRRTLKDKKSSSDAPPAAATIPQWFIDKNVVTNSSSVDKASPAHVQERQPSSNHMALNLTTPTPRPSNDSVSSPGELSTPQECDHLEDQSQKPGSGPNKPTHIDHRYAINPDVWLRLQLAVRAGFATPPAKYAHDPATEKSHLLLQYPHRRDEASVDTIGSSVFLHAVVQRLAREEEADLLILNAQDIARLCSDQVRAEGKTSSSIQNLGYEIYNTWNKRRRTDLESSFEKEDGLNDNSETSISLSGTNSRPHILPIEVTLPDTQLPNWLLSSFGASAEGSASRISRSETGAWMRVIDQLLSQPTPRASGDETSTPQTETDLKFDTSKKKIVHIQDYVELMQSREGSKFLKLLLDAIHSRRRSGRRILLIGTSSSYKDTFLDRETSLSPIAEQARLYLDSSARPFTSPIAVFPSMPPKDLNSKFAEDRSARIRCINIRHLQDMLRLRVNTDKIPIDDKIFDSASWPGDIDDESPLGALNTDYLGYTRVHNLASMIMGAVSSNETLSFEHIRQAFVAETMHKKSFERWHSLRSAGTANWTPGAGSNEPEFEEDFRPSKLDSIVQSECNKYEKKLLGGVVNAGNIRTTFADVHVPPETVEALKTLTSLSLKRPDAFTYGVLASDKIPGMLLYGPPGTGKTLLAKAVARESGATVLEVSGSDIYDMYVGEGEKNVKAIFTLARKLSPCVVFIDEADAIFGSRNQSRNRFSSHRELINQFLREWDGMNDMSAFIMVATNRPFDLDDAVLRRLPRRLLVDLPVEQDREAILKIHLKNEQLDSSVNLANLAKRTPFYSGSDLKNACVAAALACVREEYEKKTQHTGNDTYQYPERRTLTGDHFERALEEISASISEDMSSLDEIRKFDEKFGDRKARRKKKPSWGFTPLTDTQTPTDTTRVRT